MGFNSGLKGLIIYKKLVLIFHRPDEVISMSWRRGIRRICSYVTFQVFTCWRSWFSEMLSCRVPESRDSNVIKNHNTIIHGFDSPLKSKAVRFFWNVGICQTHCVVKTSQKTGIRTYDYCISISKMMGYEQEDRVSVSSWGIVHRPSAVSRPVLAPT
jgi:hypothetical protein